jgi:hypothetical protein
VRGRADRAPPRGQLCLGEHPTLRELSHKYSSRYDVKKDDVTDISAEVAEGAVSYEAVLAALESIDFPVNEERANVRGSSDVVMTSMCLGAVLSWTRFTRCAVRGAPSRTQCALSYGMA